MKKMSFLTVILLTVFAIGQSLAQTGSSREKGKSSDSSKIKSSEADTPRIGIGYGKTPSSTPGIGSSTTSDSAMTLPNPATDTPGTGIKPANRTLRPRTTTPPLPSSGIQGTENKDTGTTGTTGTGSQTTTPKP